MNNENANGLKIIAQRYADALVSIASETDQLDAISNELNIINQTFKDSPDLKKFLEHPNIPTSDKKEVMTQVFSGTVSKNVLSFIKLLLDKNRMIIFATVLKIYTASLLKIRNIMTAKVITAIEINEEIKQKIKSKLENLYEKTVQVEYSTNESLIAGMVVKIEDKTIDGSVKTKLENMKKQVI